MIFCGIMAGGTGTRMGVSGVPKQFLHIGGVPILVRTVREFLSFGGFEGIVVCSPEEYIAQTKSLLSEYGCADNVSVIAGGKNRNGSVLNVCRFFCEQFSVTDEDIIVTHDAVRPFINSRIIEDNIRLASEYGAANTVVPVVDTILKSINGSFIDGVPDRSELYRVQTPQTFILKAVTQALEDAGENGRARYTDTAGLFFDTGRRVALVRGEECNIKLTTKFDLSIAEAYIQSEKDD